MNTLLDWIDQRTGIRTATCDWLHRPVAGGPSWRNVWPGAIAFVFIIQAITGFVLWMYYSPGSQTAWESVYYVQHQVQGEQLRVTGKKRDDLQGVIAACKEHDFGIPLQFGNFRD